jgi:RNAse (barnase) inhibitor barstar
MRLILSPFFDQMTDEEKLYRHFMQSNSMAHTANNSVDALDGFFGNQVII